MIAKNKATNEKYPIFLNFFNKKMGKKTKKIINE